jgi:hypothetical protein
MPRVYLTTGKETTYGPSIPSLPTGKET